MKASATGRAASARQIMYKARPIIQGETGEQLNDAISPQVAAELHDRVRCQLGRDIRRSRAFPRAAHRSLGRLRHACSPGIYQWYARTELSELRLSLRQSTSAWPRGTFGAVLFVEKEGFMPVFESVNLPSGLTSRPCPPRACRSLVVPGCWSIRCAAEIEGAAAGSARARQGRVLRLGKLRHRPNRRYQYHSRAKVIDLACVLRMSTTRAQRTMPRTPSTAEMSIRTADQRAREQCNRGGIEFLLEQRVELNAMSSDILIGGSEAAHPEQRREDCAGSGELVAL